MATKKEYEYYQKILKILGSLTNLFSESKVPYLNYRITENLFCKAFTAKNLSRSDVSPCKFFILLTSIPNFSFKNSSDFPNDFRVL